MSTEYLLSENDKQSLMSILAWAKGRGISLVREPKPTHEQHIAPAPDIYIAQAPSTGIGVSSQIGTGSSAVDTPAYATCLLFKLQMNVDGSQAGATLVNTGEQKIVYSLTPVAGNTWIVIARDKHGTWWVINTEGGDVIVEATSQSYETISLSGGGSINAYPAQSLILLDGQWTPQAIGWFYGINNEIPIKGGYNCVPVATDLNGLPVWSTDIISPTIMVEITSLTSSIVDLSNGGTISAYPAMAYALTEIGTGTGLGAEAGWVESGVCWWIGANEEIPASDNLSTRYLCRWVQVDIHGVNVFSCGLSSLLPSATTGFWAKITGQSSASPYNVYSFEEVVDPNPPNDWIAGTGSSALSGSLNAEEVGGNSNVPIGAIVWMTPNADKVGWYQFNATASQLVANVPSGSSQYPAQVSVDGTLSTYIDQNGNLVVGAQYTTSTSGVIWLEPNVSNITNASLIVFGTNTQVVVGFQGGGGPFLGGNDAYVWVGNPSLQLGKVQYAFFGGTSIPFEYLQVELNQTGRIVRQLNTFTPQPDLDQWQDPNGNILVRVTGLGSVVVGYEPVTTTATDGFLYVSSCLGKPTGTPTSFSGGVPIVVDATNSQVWFYSGGEWWTPAGSNLTTVNNFVWNIDNWTINVTGTIVINGSVELCGSQFWCCSTLTGINPPAAPTLSTMAGSTPASIDAYVKITYVTPLGESEASAEASISVQSNEQLVVDSPVASQGATGWNVYAFDASGEEVLQNTGGPIAIGTNWTEPTTGLLLTGTPAPTSHNFTTIGPFGKTVIDITSGSGSGGSTIDEITPAQIVGVNGPQLLVLRNVGSTPLTITTSGNITLPPEYQGYGDSVTLEYLDAIGLWLDTCASGLWTVLFCTVRLDLFEWVIPSSGTLLPITLTSGTIYGYLANIGIWNDANGSFGVGRQVYLYDVNKNTPTVGDAYQSRYLGEDASGNEIWGESIAQPAPPSGYTGTIEVVTSAVWDASSCSLTTTTSTITVSNGLITGVS